METIQSGSEKTGPRDNRTKSRGDDQLSEAVSCDPTAGRYEQKSSVGYFCCPSSNQTGWYPLEEIRLPITDLGFRQGVTAVERLRTYQGQLFQRQRHLDRLAGTLQSLGLSERVSVASIDTITTELLDRNHAWVQSQGDIGVTWWVTPDSYALHCNAIDHHCVVHRREYGQSLILTNVQQPSALSWSRQAKVRSRVHYYLADQEANSVKNGSIGVLRDEDGTWTEASIANLALATGGNLVFPPREQVLNGVTQSVVRDIASELGIQCIEQPVRTSDIQSSDEVLLMGTDSGLWFASDVHVFDRTLIRKFGIPNATSITRRLQACMPQFG